MPKPRILFLTSSAPLHAGDSTAPFILNMAQDLCDLGYAVDILAPHSAGCARDEMLGDVRIIRFRYMWPQRLQTLARGGSAMVNLRQNPLNALLIPFFILAQWIACRRLIRSNEYDLIHSHWLLPQGFIGSRIARRFHLPHIVMVHGADIFSLKHRIFRFFKRTALLRSDAIIANSSYTKQRIEQLDKSIGQRPISVIPTGTTPCTSQPNTLLRDDYAARDDRILLFVGRLVEEKGLRYLLEALSAILEHQTVTLLVVGDGVQRKSYETLVARLGLTDHVRFIGAVPHDHIYDYYALADVFIGPSVSTQSGWVEAQGNTFVEAMFAHVPVVASDIGGICDAVIHEQTGLLVPEKSPDAIAEAVCRILDDESLRQHLASNAYEHAHKYFSRYGSAQRIAQLYAQLLAG